MIFDKTSIESTTGLLAVGSLTLLGLFMFLDGRTEIFYVVENYGKSTAWSIVAAIPTLVVAYILGLLATTFAELIFRRIGRLHMNDDIPKLFKIARLGNDFITQEYLGLLRQQTLLEGSSISFIVICLGILSMSHYNPGYERLGCAIAVGSLILAVVTPFCAARLAHKSRSFIEAIESAAPSASPR